MKMTLSEPLLYLPNPIKASLDLTSIGITVGAFMSWLPHITALFTLIWTILRILETEPVRRWTKKWKRNHKKRRNG